MGQELYRVIVASSLFVCVCYVVNYAANPNAERPSTIFDQTKPMILEASPSPEPSGTPSPDEPERMCVCGSRIEREATDVHR